ncbi:hypothetical protein IPJ72_04320 [Candidatus Peregrinibacteria bacterium]|nr:MAG: hypothetical protein IPJ72_04320 [Candidatus Peregrinibacteria bacterium]
MNQQVVIYLQIDDEISTILERIGDVSRPEIYLIIPKKALIFQSVINLKILKTKLEKPHRRLVIVTADRKGRYLAEQCDLQVLSEMPIESTPIQVEESKLDIKPIQARRTQEGSFATPQRTTEKKVSIRELINQYRLNTAKKSLFARDENTFILGRPSRKLITMLTLGLISLFMLIGYIALPSATIYIKPTFDSVDFSLNVTLADEAKNQTLIRQRKTNIIPSQVVKTSTGQTKTFPATSKEFNGKNASGSIKLINTSGEEWQLRKGTRFQTEGGLIFRSDDWVVVPPRSKDEAGTIIPGEAWVAVTADPFDLYASPIGDRGNIEPTKFSIPGLTKFSQSLIWGESSEPMRGGFTGYRNVVLQEDIDAATNQIKNNLIELAKADLKNDLAEKNRANQTNLVLLTDQDYLTIELTDLRVADDLVGSSKEKFEVFARIEASGIAFDFNALFSLLKTELAKRTHPSMRLREDSIIPDNIVYEVIEDEMSEGRLKLTATISGIEEFVIDSSTPAGIEFGTKVKNQVAGLTLAEAENLIENLSEVDKVEIKTWPIWMSRIPHVPEKIEFKLMD